MDLEIYAIYMDLEMRNKSSVNEYSLQQFVHEDVDGEVVVRDSLFSFHQTPGNGL